MSLVSVRSVTYMSSSLEPDTLNLQFHAELSLNYLYGNLDLKRSGLPYFHTFLRPDPPELRHDWPDYGDLTGRFVDAIILARHMTGCRAGGMEEALLKKLLLSYFSENDGLSFRPESPWSAHDALMFDQGRVLMALTTWYLQAKESRVRDAMERMVNGLWKIAVKEEDYCYILFKAYPPTGWDERYDGGRGAGGRADPCYDGGQWILSLVRYYDAMGSEAALRLARGLLNWNVYHSDVFGKDGSFHGHFHSRMATIAGVLRYALTLRDLTLVKWGKRVFDYAQTLGGSIGWYPESTGNPEGCETCCITDMVDCAILLTRAGYPEYWNVVERIARNHLIESQLRDVSWVRCRDRKEDTEFSSFANVAERVKGGFAGLSAPNDFIGRRGWGNNPYWMMNCCGPAGMHAIYLVWHNIVSKDGRGVFVNMALNRDTKWVKVASHHPYDGKVEVLIHEAPTLFIRVPDWVNKAEVMAKVEDKPQPLEWDGDYIKLVGLRSGQKVVVTYPLREVEREEFISMDVFTLTWRGDTVVRVEPLGKHYPLYRRECLTKDYTPFREVTYSVLAEAIHW